MELDAIIENKQWNKLTSQPKSQQATINWMRLISHTYAYNQVLSSGAKRRGWRN